MGPLSDIKVLDLSEKLTGSLATMYLTNYGANVTKLEKPVQGDAARKWEPKNKEESIYFNYLNNGKSSITLNIETEEGKEIFKKLIPLFDVVCVSYPVGYLDSIGLGYEVLKQIKPDLIYASVTPFGEEGPMAKKAGSSLTVQAKGVAMDMTGVVNEEPINTAPSLTEHYAAGYLATGIVMVMIDKKVKGKGQKIDISLQDSIFSCIETAPSAYSTVSEIHTRKGNNDPSCAPYDNFETLDGFVAIGCATEPQWIKLCDALGFDDLKSNPKFKTIEQRRTDYFVSLRPVLADKLAKMTKAEVQQKCSATGVPCGAVLSVDEVTDMPNTAENGFLMSIVSEKLGTIRRPSLPFKLSDTPATIYPDAPELGENTVEVLGELGLDEKELAQLKSKNII